MASENRLTSFELCKMLEDYHPRLVSYARYFTNDQAEAEDIVQDSLYNFLRKYNSCTETEFSKLIFSITRNCCLDFLKHKKVVGNLIIPENPKGEMLYNFDFLGQEADGGYLYDELLKQVDTILNRLPAKCREVFEMSRFKRMSNEDIAQSLNISVKTVKNHMTRALSEFRKSL